MLLRSAGIMGWTGVVGAFALVVWTSSVAAAATLTVGPGKTYTTIKDAVAAGIK